MLLLKYKRKGLPSVYSSTSYFKHFFRLHALNVRKVVLFSLFLVRPCLSEPEQGDFHALLPPPFPFIFTLRKYVHSFTRRTSVSFARPLQQRRKQLRRKERKRGKESLLKARKHSLPSLAEPARSLPFKNVSSGCGASLPPLFPFFLPRVYVRTKGKRGGKDNSRSLR